MKLQPQTQTQTCNLRFKFWDGAGLKTFLGPTYEENQLWFLKYSSIFLFFTRPYFDLFCAFLALWVFFCGRNQVQKICLEPSNVE